MPSVGDIAIIVQDSSIEDSILIAKTEILCLDELSLDGDLPDDISL
jgi:hypothetical protein